MALQQATISAGEGEWRREWKVRTIHFSGRTRPQFGFILSSPGPAERKLPKRQIHITSVVCVCASVVAFVSVLVCVCVCA